MAQIKDTQGSEGISLLMQRTAETIKSGTLRIGKSKLKRN